MIRTAIYFILASTLFAKSGLIDVKFSIDSPAAKKVSLQGSFDNWRNQGTPLVKKDSLWQVTLKLKPGYYYYRFLVDSNLTHDPANDWKISDGGNGFISVVMAGEPPAPKRKLINKPLPKYKLPVPILEDNPEWVELYYSAWEMLWNKTNNERSIKRFIPVGAVKNSAEQDEIIDAEFPTLFTMYAPDIFPAVRLLDEFYSRQRSDGYIPGTFSPAFYGEDPARNYSNPSVNPVLFPWLELRYYDLTGDRKRLEKVLPLLIDNFSWISQNISDPTGLGVFYDNTLKRLMQYGVKDTIDKSGSIDLSCQQALAAMSIANIATALEDDMTARDFYVMHYFISKNINKNYWDYGTNFYYDLNKTGDITQVKHIGAYWTLLAQVSDSLTTSKLLEHLVNPEEFWRPHLVPSLSADDENYDPLGYFKRGAVWSQANYMLIKGLENYGEYDLAGIIAANHLDNISAVYQNFTPDENRIAYEERFGDNYQTIWEGYSPEVNSPCRSGENSFYSRQDFAGGAGIAAISMLIENIIGIEARGCRNKVKWRIRREDKHGIKNFNFRGNKIDLVCNPSPDEYKFTVKCSSPFILEIDLDGKKILEKIDYGNTAFSVPRESNLHKGITKN